jgi:hypothetical protein
MESSFSKIDNYLISIFKAYEKQKIDYIHIDELVKFIDLDNGFETVEENETV